MAGALPNCCKDKLAKWMSVSGLSENVTPVQRLSQLLVFLCSSVVQWLVWSPHRKRVLGWEPPATLDFLPDRQLDLKMPLKGKNTSWLVVLTYFAVRHSADCCVTTKKQITKQKAVMIMDGCS